MKLAYAFIAVFLIVGCKDEGVNAGTPGTLRVNLTTPNSGLDGAAVVMISGPAVPRGVNAGAGLKLWGAPVQSSQASVALTGTLSTGTILTIDVADIALADQYSASLREVSKSDSTVALRVLTGYSLTVQ
jgi:hypothetical protein